MVEKAERHLQHSPFMQNLMHPVLVDIAIDLWRGDVPNARRMGLDQAQLDAIVAMRTP